MTQFNLIDEPWIPVRALDGEERELGLAQLYADAGDLRELAIPFALESVATLRILITILQAALDGPRSVNEDKVRWLSQHGDLAPKVAHYLETWRPRFELFSRDRPFMQPATDTSSKMSTSAALRPDWASGNNATLFDHRWDGQPEPLAPGAAVRALLMTQLFQPGGGVSRPFNRTDSPGTKSLHTWVDGATLWETIVVNAPVLRPYDDARPVWERDDDHTPDRAGTHPIGWLDRATWRSRAIELLPDENGMVSTCRLHQHLKIADGPPFDPFAPIRRAEGKDPVALRPSAGKALWRDAEALLRGLADESHATVVAEAIAVYAHRGEPAVPSVRAVGQVVNQAKVVEVRDARFPVSASMLENEAHVVLVGSLVEAADVGAAAVRAGVHAFAVSSGAKDGWSLARRWEASYWASRPAGFRRRMYEIASASPDTEVVDLYQAAVRPWQGEVIAAARAAYQACARQGAHDPRVAKALAMGRAALESRLAKLSSHGKETR